VCVIFQNALGAFTAPMVLGALSDSYGIKTAISVLPIFLVISAVLFFLGSFFYEKDLSKVEKVELEMEG
jgi:ATP/ADP translocase